MGDGISLYDKYQKMLRVFEEEKLDTWFDMGLFLDRVKDTRLDPQLPESFLEFKKNVAKGIAFITFDYGIDGVSIEISKYCRAFECLFEENGNISIPKIHWIGGHFFKETETIMESRWNKICLPEIWAFGEWDGYQEFFHTTLARGSKEYNLLADKLLKSTQNICQTLGKKIVDNDIRLLFPVNVASNPGNVALAFALAIISEYLDIPVIANHHDFYWEEGKRARQRKKNNEPPGFRDHFFRNAEIGEVFSMIENLYPWEGRRWLHTMINGNQQKALISQFGFNPICIKRIPTSVDIESYDKADQEVRGNILYRLHQIFSCGNDILAPRPIDEAVNTLEKENTGIDPLFLGVSNKLKVDIKSDNLMLLQPTRIIRRKRIELNFTLLRLLLTKTAFKELFSANNKLTITFLITGPIANGHNDYFSELLDHFESFLLGLPDELRERVFLAMPFGLENQPILKEKGLDDVTIEDIYKVASLTLLPSETEGRGLPIVESSAAGVPIVCNRYSPEEVYREVIGEDLDEKDRIIVFDFKGKDFSLPFIERIAQIFLNPERLDEMRKHNREVVRNRFSKKALVNSLDFDLYTLWERAHTDVSVVENIKNAFDEHHSTTVYDNDFKKLVLSENRKYLGGYTLIEFMIYLKSLIDPSFFRTEEMELRGRVMSFAQNLFNHHFKFERPIPEKEVLFFKHLDELFTYFKGEDPLAIDHSLSYRHRHRRHYPMRKLTEQELCGVVGILFRKIMGESIPLAIDDTFDWEDEDILTSVRKMLEVDHFVIDNSKKLLADIKSKKEIAVFPGPYFWYELKIFALDTLKERIGIPLGQKVSKENLEDKSLENVAPVSFFLREHPIDEINYQAFVNWLERGANHELKLLYEKNLLRVIKTSMLSTGVHLAQLGKEAINELVRIKNNGGFLVCTGPNSFMVDMVDMPNYRLGRAHNQLNANFMGLELNDAYIQWVPRGLKPSLAYPTPIQTPKNFSKILKGKLFRECAEKFGEEAVLNFLREDADTFGNPIEICLKHKLSEGSASDSSGIFSTQINGIYDDTLPWSGAMVKVDLQKHRYDFDTIFSGKTGKTVLSLIEEFENSTGEKVSFAWNGGYILNPELVGKLGLPEDYIGSPLGLVCTNGKIVALPLYNKAGFIIKKDGKIEIKRLNLQEGLTIIKGSSRLVLGKEARNLKSLEKPIYYDLLWEDKSIPAENRIIYRFMGNKVIEKIENSTQPIKVIPVGLTLSVHKDDNSFVLDEGDEVYFELPGLSDINSAIEAGPLLVDQGKEAIDMKIEGWKTENSISTQAARLDYIDMRGPKIGVGLTKNNEIVVIAINGRIRESVGATHIDLANILIRHGAQRAMGFDPGGSVTVVIDGKQLNISPYNKNYEDNIYSLPPQPRTVANAILGIMRE